MKKKISLITSRRLLAIRLTLEHRGTRLPEKITALSEEFVIIKRSQWNAFHKRQNQECIPADFEVIIIAIKQFLEPIISALNLGTKCPQNWPPAGHWK